MTTQKVSRCHEAFTNIRSYRLAKDQTEINRIIADASKGSKFYEVGDALECMDTANCPLRCMQNEKRKDKELTEHIQRILKQRDEVMKGADISMQDDAHLWCS